MYRRRTNSYDCAVSREIAELKDFRSPCAGLRYFAGSQYPCRQYYGKNAGSHLRCKAGGFVVGAKCPVVMTSRGSSAEEKYLSIVISALVSQK